MKFSTYTLFALALMSCLLSISNNDLYQDGEWANAQWLGQDLVTLLLAAPLLLLSYFKGVKRANAKWTLVFTGVLMYFAYTYAFYMFAARLTVLYLFHLPIFSLSLIGLVLSLILIFCNQTEFSLKNRRVRALVIIYLGLISLMLVVLWSSDIISHLLLPEHRSDTPDGEAPLIIYSLDLALIIPLMLASAFLLARKHRSGYLLGGIMLVKTSVLGFALMAMATSMYLQGLNPDYFQVLLWCIIGLLGSGLSVLYLGNLAPK